MLLIISAANRWITTNCKCCITSAHSPSLSLLLHFPTTTPREFENCQVSSPFPCIAQFVPMFSWHHPLPYDTRDMVSGSTFNLYPLTWININDWNSGQRAGGSGAVETWSIMQGRRIELWQSSWSCNLRWGSVLMNCNMVIGGQPFSLSTSPPFTVSGQQRICIGSTGGKVGSGRVRQQDWGQVDSGEPGFPVLNVPPSCHFDLILTDNKWSIKMSPSIN